MKGKRVFAGLSGGVDSATAAALLQRDGYDVTGVFIRIWRPEFLECTWQEDRLDAMRVAARLSIPFREVDLSEEYKREVIDTMLAGYRAGITPNPDVLCNERVKFGAFFRWAIANGADMVATGHYARVERQGDSHALLRGIDPAKDQSYFLYRLGQGELAQTLFPVGAFRKQEIRSLAARFGLPTAQKPDSQGLCFVGDIELAEFIRRFVPAGPGSVFDTVGNRIGHHDGALFYTVGQRHGFVVEGERGRQPHYVVHVDTAANAIVVSPQREDAAVSSAFIMRPHWIQERPEDGAHLIAQTRYHGEPAGVTVLHEGDGDTVRISFDEPRIAAPEQSIVLYEGDRCLGGGPVFSSTRG